MQGITSMTHIEKNEFLEETGIRLEAIETGSTNVERAIRIVLLTGFFLVLVLEAWLLWQVWLHS